MHAGKFVVGHPGLLQPDKTVLVRAPGPHRTDVAGVGLQRLLDRGHVELRVVGEHRDDRARVDLLAGQPAVRPVDDDLVGVGEPLRRGEHRAGVDDGHLEAEQLAHAHQCRGEVDRAEHDHARLGCEGLHEDVEALAEALARGPVVQEPGGAGLQQAERVLAHGVVEPGGAERALGAIAADDDVAADVMRSGDDGGDRHRLLRGDAGGDAVELRPGLLVDALDEDLEDPPAGQAHGEGIVVADSIGLQPGLAVGQHLLAEVEQGPLDAPAADGADGLALVRDEHGCPGWSWCRAPGAHDGGHRRAAMACAYGHQLREYLAHDHSDSPGRSRARGQ